MYRQMPSVRACAPSGTLPAGTARCASLPPPWQCASLTRAGVCHPSFAAYREAMRAFAAEVGAPFIDLGAATAAANTAFGAERCKARYMWVGAKQDNAHQQNAGACRTAQAFVQQLLQDTTPALDVLRANFK